MNRPDRGYQLAENVSLAGRNTFRIAARAARMADIHNPEALAEVFDLAVPDDSTPVMVLGEGSNVLFADDFPGLVICLTNASIGVLEERSDSVLVRADAGVVWNDLVNWTLARGLPGLENLALIPGTVGACPIQNIGAYGVEVGDFIETVEAFQRDTGQLKRLAHDDCAFAYRDSRFKREIDRWVITAVELRLPRQHALRMDYVGIHEELAAMQVNGTPRPSQLAEAISRIRTRKLPNPAVLGNAGSFFKNPMLPSAEAHALQAQHPGLPLFSAGLEGWQKISAAWLIEACGWKGFREGDAGVSEQHALVLVNHGAASGPQLMALAQRIADSVQARFGLMLEPEPRIMGARFDEPRP